MQKVNSWIDDAIRDKAGNSTFFEDAGENRGGTLTVVTGQPVYLVPHKMLNRLIKPFLTDVMFVNESQLDIPSDQMINVEGIIIDLPERVKKYASEEVQHLIANHPNHHLPTVLDHALKSAHKYCENEGFNDNYNVILRKDPEDIRDSFIEMQISLEKEFTSFEEAMKVEDNIAKKVYTDLEKLQKGYSKYEVEGIKEAIDNMAILLANVSTLPVESIPDLEV